MKVFPVISLILLIVLFISPVEEQGELHAQSMVRLTLEHADTARSEYGIRHLIGNVRVRRGDLYLTAERASHNGRTGVIDLKGNVRMEQEDQVLTTLHLVYYDFTGNYDAEGAVHFTKEDSIDIKCRTAKFTAADSMLQLVDDVVIENLSSSNTITGKRARWFDIEKKALVTGSPVYSMPPRDENSTDTLVISSEILEYYHQENYALFTGRVDLTRSDLASNSDTLFHYPDSGYTMLSGEPVIWRSGDKLRGDEINLYSSEGNLDSIYIENNALVLNKAHETSELCNRLNGKYLRITMFGDSSRVIQVRGDAEAEYHIWDDEEIYQGVNLSAADKIVIRLVDDKVQEINLTGSTSGAFYPPGMEPESSRKHEIGRERAR